jgi:hypothetical protein
MTFLCAIMITLSGITWYQGAIVVDYTNQQAVAIHYMGHRMYYLEVQCACPSDICVCVRYLRERWRLWWVIVFVFPYT